MEKKPKKNLLFEIAWEVCNQVGGIYTVIRSKVPAMVDQWGDEYVCLGPYFPQRALTEYEPITSDDGSGLYQVVQKMREEGLACLLYTSRCGEETALKSFVKRQLIPPPKLTH